MRLNRPARSAICLSRASVLSLAASARMELAESWPPVAVLVPGIPVIPTSASPSSVSRSSSTAWDAFSQAEPMDRRMVSGTCCCGSSGTWGRRVAINVSTAVPAAMASPWHSATRRPKAGSSSQALWTPSAQALSFGSCCRVGEAGEVPGVELVEDLVLELQDGVVPVDGDLQAPGIPVEVGVPPGHVVDDPLHLALRSPSPTLTARARSACSSPISWVDSSMTVMARRPADLVSMANFFCWAWNCSSACAAWAM